MVEQALAYARANIPVLPLSGKIPRTEHGKDDATTDPRVIRAWWRQFPDANIGVRPPTGVAVLDVDPRNGGTLDSLRPYPETRMARTGSGGWHLWFRFDGESRGRLGGGPGVDVKTHRGYLVAPPSVHPETHQRYTWSNSAPIQPLPAHLRARIRPVHHPIRVAAVPGGDGSGLVKVVAAAREGERNNLLFWSFVTAMEEGADPQLLADIAGAARSIGLSEYEIERTLRSAERHRI
ncbi:DNA primase [Nocardia panacis]|uniref:DNA primase n=1 Tax=Nocardia panacis TaxID=2340916 RepID=A0A3A4KI92_9NOCA|nr:bifunctional DNA primase/polymerase [Nocardia panacis]RJO79329.1 DNA primase [Nocardia panacis]